MKKRCFGLVMVFAAVLMLFSLVVPPPSSAWVVTVINEDNEYILVRLYYISEGLTERVHWSGYTEIKAGETKTFDTAGFCPTRIEDADSPRGLPNEVKFFHGLAACANHTVRVNSHGNLTW